MEPMGNRGRTTVSEKVVVSFNSKTAQHANTQHGPPNTGSDQDNSLFIKHFISKDRRFQGLKHPF